MFLSVFNHFSIQWGQSVGGIFDIIADYIYSQIVDRWSERNHKPHRQTFFRKTTPTSFQLMRSFECRILKAPEVAFVAKFVVATTVQPIPSGSIRTPGSGVLEATTRNKQRVIISNSCFAVPTTQQPFWLIGLYQSIS